jgi:hypothetical protein
MQTDGETGPEGGRRLRLQQQCLRTAMGWRPRIQHKCTAMWRRPSALPAALSNRMS